MPEDALSNMTPDSATKLLGSLNEEALAAFSSAQISHIPTTVFEALTAEQQHFVVLSLSTEAIGGVTAAQIAAMPEDALSNMTPDSATKLLGSLNEEALAAFSSEQISHIPTTVFEAMDVVTFDNLLTSLSVDAVVGITNAQLHVLAPDVFASLSLAYLEGLTPAQTGGITDAQIAALNPEQLTALGNDYLQVEAGVDEPGSASVSGDLLVFGDTVTVLSPAGAAGVVSIDTGSGQWNFTLDPGLSDRFVAGEIETQVYTILADIGGQVSEQKVFVTVTGTNDLPKLDIVKPESTVYVSGQHSAWHEIFATAGVWSSPNGAANGITEEFEFTRTIDIQADGIYTVEISADNYGTVLIGGVTVTSEGFQSVSSGQVTLNAGTHDIDILGGNTGGPNGVAVRILDDQANVVWTPHDALSITLPVLRTTEDGAVVQVELAQFASDVDSDDDGASLTYTVSGAPSEGVATISGTTLNFDPADNFQGLTKGETRYIIIEVTATDTHGATAIDTVTVTVTGTNDAPQIQVVDVVGDIIEGTTLTDNGSLTFTDVDLTDSPVATFAATSVAAMNGSAALALTNVQQAAIEAAFTINNEAGNANDGTVSWDYTITEGAIDFLGEGETVTAIFTVTVTDDEQATATQDVTVTITGTNDAPQIQVVNVVGDIIEGTTLTDNGSLTFTDVDLTDSPVATFAATSNDTFASVTSTGLIFSGSSPLLVRSVTDTNNNGVPDQLDVAAVIGASGYIYGMDYDDLDGDGDVDFVGATSVGLAIFTNQGDTDNDGNDNFITSTINSSTNYGVLDVTIADFNGDGHLDITSVGRYYNEVLFGNGGNGDNVLNISDYTLSTIGSTPGFGYVYGVDSGDLNGDGFTDFVRSAYSNGPLQIFYSDGAAGTFSTQVIEDAYDENSMGIDIGDIDGDGDLDFLLTRWGNKSDVIYYNDGDTNNDGQLEFTTQVINPNDDNIEGELFDIDSDGDLDILLADYSNGEIDIFFNDGGRSFSQLTLNGVSPSTIGLGVGDIDEDGDFDIVLARNSGTGNTTVFVNNGDTNDDGVIDFTSEALAGTPASWDVAFINSVATMNNGAALALTNVQQAAIEAAFTINNEAGNANDGTVSWDYTITEGALDFLGEGEAVTANFTVTVTDDEQATATQDVTVTITGTNDAPQIQVVNVVGDIIEGTTLTDNGSLTFTDVDLTDSPVATFAATSVAAMNGTAALALTNVQQAAIEAAFTINNEAGNANDGTVSWDYTITEGTLDFLGEGETVTAIFTVNVTDDEQATATQDVTVTITGTNDAPQFFVVGEGDESFITEGSVLADSGSLDFIDVDLTDTPDVLATPKSISATLADGTTPLELSTVQQAAIQTAFAISNVSDTGRVSWGYAIDEGELDFLAAGETVTFVVTVTVTDDEQATAIQDVTVTITGTNDAPQFFVVGEGDESFITEGSVLADSGSLDFIDVDLTDTPDVLATPKSISATLADGTTPLELSTVQQAAIQTAFAISNVSDTGRVSWGYAIDEGELDFLAAGETVTFVVTVTVTDDEQATATQDVTVTVTGTNDAPQIQVVDVVGDIIEGTTLTDNGSLTFTDVDLTDSPVATFAATSVAAMNGSAALALTNVQQAAIEAAFTINNEAGNANDGTVSWDYTITEGAIDFLGEGETVTAIFTVTVTDDEQATATQDVTVTVTGTNDAPIIDVATSDLTGAVTESAYVAVPPVTAPAGLVFTDTTNITLANAQLETGLNTSSNPDVVNGSVGPLLTYTPDGAFNTFDANGTYGAHNLNDGDIGTTPTHQDGTYAIPDGGPNSLRLDLGGVTTLSSIAIYNGYGNRTDGDYSLTDGEGNVLGGWTVSGTPGSSNLGVHSFWLTFDTPVTTNMLIFNTTSVEGNLTNSYREIQVFGPPALTDSGVTVFTDVDLTDTHAIDPTIVASADVLGALTASVTSAAAGVATGEITWDYSVASDLVDYLAAGETKVETFEVTVMDAFGASATETVSVTITGTNDNPVALNDTLASGPADAENWTYNSDNGHYYRVVDEGSTFAEAISGSDALGGYLATITSASEQAFIKANGLVAQSTDGTWIGGQSSNPANPSAWSWVTGPEAGQSLAYSNWHPGEPNGGFSAPIQYAQIVGSWDYTWNDAPNSGQPGNGIADGYLIEWGGRPEDTAFHENTVLTIDAATLLANDTDVDTGAVLSLTAVSALSTAGVPVSLSGTDVTYDPTVVFNHLAAGETATDTFTYTVTDEFGATDTATVSITVTGTNDAPVALAEASSGDEDTAINGQLVASDVDNNQADLTFALDTGPSNGTVTVNGDGSYSYTGDQDFNGTDSFTYQVSDGDGGLDTETITITVNGTNDVPIIGTADITGSVTATAIDPVVVESSDIVFTVEQFTGYQSNNLSALEIYAANNTAKYIVETNVIDYTDDPAGFSGELPGSSPWPAAQANGVTGIGGINNVFFARITTEFSVSAADTYTFRTFNDDGVFLKIDGNLIIDDAGYHGESVHTGSIALTPGAHTVELFFFENGGEASLELSVSDSSGVFGLVGGSGGGLGGVVTQVTDSGVIEFTDVDFTDTHTVSVDDNDTDYLGSLTATIADDTTGDQGGNIVWDFAVDNTDIVNLGAGEQLNQDYTVTVADGKGGTAQEVVSVTLYGTNIIVGSESDDILTGLGGDDTLTGGLGADTFFFNPEGGNDIITDFGTGDDVIDLSAFTGMGYDNVILNSTQTEDGVNIDLGNGNSVTLVGVSLDSLDAGDFAFG
jgi:VCBS repeat-containing protein